MKVVTDYGSVALQAKSFFADRSNTGETTSPTAVFEDLESNVRTYCRSFPAVFSKAKGALLFDERGSRYIDFPAGSIMLRSGNRNRGCD